MALVADLVYLMYMCTTAVSRMLFSLLEDPAPRGRYARFLDECECSVASNDEEKQHKNTVLLRFERQTTLAWPLCLMLISIKIPACILCLSWWPTYLKGANLLADHKSGASRERVCQLATIR